MRMEDAHHGPELHDEKFAAKCRWQAGTCLCSAQRAPMTDQHVTPENGVDYETALSDPAAYYHEPETVLTDADLSLAQKKRFLEEWAQDLADRQVADAEGMGSGTPGESADESDFLKRIHACLEQLGVAAKTEHPGRVRWQVKRTAA